MSALIAAIDELAADFARRLLETVRRSSLEQLAALPAAATDTRRRRRRRRVTARTLSSVASDWAERYGLSGTELEILILAAHGSSREALARDRHVTVNTIKRQIFTLLRKTGDASLLHAVTRLLREVLGQRPTPEARRPRRRWQRS